MTIVEPSPRKLRLLDQIDVGVFFLVTVTHVLATLGALLLAGLTLLGVVADAMPLVVLVALAVASKVYLVVAMHLGGRRADRRVP